MNVLLFKVSQDSNSCFTFSSLAFIGTFHLTDRCGPSEQGGSVFDPSSYTCTATCQLTNGAPSTPIGVFHNEIVNDLLPTLHGTNRGDGRHRVDCFPFVYSHYRRGTFFPARLHVH